MERVVNKRDVAICIVLSIVTCGIYGIYWLIVLADDMNALAKDGDNTSGGVVYLLTLVTCGIYGIYWAYKQGQRIDTLKGNPSGSTGILYLVLNICGLGIVTYALMQNEINNLIADDNQIVQ